VFADIRRQHIMIPIECSDSHRFRLKKSFQHKSMTSPEKWPQRNLFMLMNSLTCDDSSALVLSPDSHFKALSLGLDRNWCSCLPSSWYYVNFETQVLILVMPFLLQRNWTLSRLFSFAFLSVFVKRKSGICGF